MPWSTPVDFYCERTDPSLWAEPVNAVTNAAFLVAALVAFLEWRRGTRGDTPSLVLIGVVALVGLGSFIFHTIATRGAALFDVIPIAVFIYGYLLLALRRFLALRLLPALAVLVGFVIASDVTSWMVPADALNGSVSYVPALTALVVVGWLVRHRIEGKPVLLAAALFMISLGLRSVDLLVCDAFPLGTHFVWHILNAVVLYLLLHAAMRAGDIRR
ncbi:MAG: ceramidase domain-containing protein [Xanthobacteraceae bacterium]